jgi:PAS domain S-box-containing protein
MSKESIDNSYSEIQTLKNELNELKEENRRLKENNEKCDFIKESLSDVIWVFNLNKNEFAYISPSMYDLRGYTPEEVLQHSLEEALTPESFKIVKDAMESRTKEFIETGKVDKSKIFELQQPHKDGRIIWTETTTNYRYNNDGEIELIGISRGIDHKKKLEEDLRKTEEKFSLAMNATKDGIWDWDVISDEAYFSPAYFEMLGYDSRHENHLNGFWEENTHPLDKEKVNPIINDCIIGKIDSFSIEFRMRKKDGEWLPILSRGKVVSRNEDGRATRIVGTHVDLSHIKKAEKAKEISDQMFRMISANTSDMFVIHNPDYSMNYISESIIGLTGYTAEEYMNFDPIENVHPEDRELLKEKLYELISGMETIVADYRIFHKNGDSIWVETRSKTIRNDDGEIISIISSTNDITDKKITEKKLIESEERYRNLIETASDAIYLIDDNGDFIDVNESACKSLGRTREELLQMNITDVDPNFTPEQFRDFWNNFPVNHQHIFETTHKRKDGSIYPVEVSGKKSKINDIIYYYGIARNISDRKEAEIKLIESEKNYRELISHIPSVVYKFSSKNGAMYWSERVKDVLGFSPDDLFNDPYLWVNAVHPDYKELIIKFSTDQEIGQEYGIEYRIKRSDGKWIWLFDSLIHKEKHDDETIIVGQAIDITQRKEAEIALKEREELFRTLYENIGEGIAFADSDDVFLYANPAAERIFGVKEDALIGRPIFDFLSEEDAKLVNRQTEIRRKGITSSYNISIKRDDGKIKTITATISPKFDSNGNFDGAFGIFRDNTEFFRQQTALKESEETLRILLDNISGSVFAHDLDGNIIITNKKSSFLLGYTEEEFLSMNVNDIDKNAIIRNDREKIWNTLKDGGTKTIESIHTRKDGSTFPVEIYISSITYKNEPIILGIANDISERKKAEMQLRESESRLLLLNNSINEMLELETLEDFYDYTTSRLHEQYKNTLVLFVSIDEENKMTTLETIKGLDSKIINKVISISGFNPIGKSYKLLQGHHKIFKSGVFTEFEGGLAEYASSEFPSFAANSLQKLFGIKKIYTIGINKEDKLLGVIHFFALKEEIKDRDFIELFIQQVGIVMERKQIESSLIEKSKELTESNATKDKFFSIIAHDLRSPLSGIMRLTEHVSKDMRNMSISELNEVFETLHKSSFYLFRLLDNLLQWSRFNRNLIDFKPYKILLKEIIEESLNVLKYKAEEREIEIVNNADENLVCWIDQSMMNTVFRNILSNAIKFSEEGGLIEIYAIKKNKKWIEISIKDHGVGIPESALPELFMLEKIASTTGVDGERGSGLGLILCKEFIDKHSGTIEIDSKQGLGTTVSFTLPIGEV